MQVCVYLLLVLHITEGCSLAENQKTDDVTAYTGDSVLLPCSCTDPHAKPESFTWRKHNTNRNSWDVITSESEQYRNRVQLGTAHSPGNLSLLISHLTEEDKGYYRCYLNQYYKDIRLTIKGISTTEFTSRFDVKTSAKAPADASTTDSAKTLTDDVQNPAGDRLYILMTTAVGAVLLLLLGLVGVLCWRYKVQRHGQTRLRKGQTEEKREQETQDSSAVLCSPVQEDSSVLNAIVNPEVKCKTAKEQDDVTYSTLVYSQKTKPASTPMDNADYTEYASIKLNSN
uniref:Ig-like domain-containing protein n=1 Tax=Electrophorus electricus TaxID=8005 RepID=A0AAY5EX82_ELEEL